MIKKILVVAVFLAAAFVISVSLLVRNAPYFIRTSLEKSLHQKVRIGAIEYRFPLAFDLRDFQIIDSEGPFAGEALFPLMRCL